MPKIMYKDQVFSNTATTKVELTQSQYNALSAADKAKDVLYMITDGGSAWDASGSSYTTVMDQLQSQANRIDELESNTPFIGTISATTNASGQVSSSLQVSDITILAAWDGGTSRSDIVIPFVANSTNWYFKVLGNGEQNNVGSTPVTIKYLAVNTPST